MRNPVSILMIVLMLFGLEACNTWSGLGKDVQDVGRRMEDAGERNHR